MKFPFGKKFFKKRVLNFSKIDQKLVRSLRKKKVPSFKQLKYLGRLLTQRERFFLKLTTLLFFLSLFLFFISLYLEKTPSPAYGGEYIEGIVGTPKYLNPIFARTDVDLDLIRLIYSRLFSYNENFELVPELIETYQTSDFKTYKFKLKKNLFWHDGAPLTAEDVGFTLEKIQDENLGSKNLLKFREVKFKKIDSTSFELSLPSPSPTFLADLIFEILPKHLLGKLSEKELKTSPYNLSPIGSGPFKFESLTLKENGEITSITLRRNENYFGKIPYLEKITFRFFPDYQEAIASLKQKKIYGLGSIPKKFKKEIENISYLNHYSFNLPHFTAIFFNQKENKFLADKTIRLALSYLIPRQKLIEEILWGEGQVIFGPILPYSEYFNPEIKKYDFNPELASETLKKAGWKKENFFKKDGQVLEITLTTINEPDLEEVGNLIKDTWTNFGIKTNLEIIWPEKFQNEIFPAKKYEALIYGIVENIEPNPFALWHSSQIKDGINLALFSHRRVDELLEKAKMSVDKEEKRKYYSEFQRIITEEIPAIFLYSPNYTYATLKTIKGINLKKINIPSERFIGIENWHIKTKR